MALDDSKRTKSKIAASKASLLKNFDLTDNSNTSNKNFDKEVRDMTSIFNVDIDNLIENEAELTTKLDEGNINFLAKSIAVNGLLQPILVLPTDVEGKYKIVGGHRRVKAYKILRAQYGDVYQTIPAFYLNTSYDSQDKEAKAWFIDNAYRRNPSLEDYMKNIKYCLDDFDQLSQEDYNEIMGIASGINKVRNRKNKADYVQKALKDLGIPNWTTTNIRRYLNIVTNGSECLNNAFTNKLIPTGVADNIATHFDVVEQDKLVTVYLEEGLDSFKIKYFAKLAQMKKTPNENDALKKTLNSFRSNIKSLKSKSSTFLNSKEFLTQKDKESLAQYKLELEQIIQNIKDLED